MVALFLQHTLKLVASQFTFNQNRETNFYPNRGIFDVADAS